MLLLFLLPTPEPALAQIDFPALTGRVVDEADILSTKTERRLARLLEAHEAETTNQVVVVTLPSLQGQTIERFGRALGDHWGIGHAGHDNGVLLIVAPQERKVRIEVGLGLEDQLTDQLAKLIIDNGITPLFRRGRFDAGVEQGTEAILRAIEGSSDAPGRRSPIWAIVFNPIVFILLGVVVLSVLLHLFMCHKRGIHLPLAERVRRQEGDEGYGWSFWSRAQSGGYTGSGLPRSVSTDYGGASGIGGGSSFSSGGGSFGGGGASGGW